MTAPISCDLFTQMWIFSLEFLIFLLWSQMNETATTSRSEVLKSQSFTGDRLNTGNMQVGSSNYGSETFLFCIAGVRVKVHVCKRVCWRVKHRNIQQKHGWGEWWRSCPPQTRSLFPRAFLKLHHSISVSQSEHLTLWLIHYWDWRCSKVEIKNIKIKPESWQIKIRVLIRHRSEPSCFPAETRERILRSTLINTISFLFNNHPHQQ